MKDRLKFRAWDKFNKIMHYDFQFIKSGEEGNDWICFVSDKQQMKCDKTKIIFDSPYFRQQIEIMQSTGLKDKNGKLIYEGDIVQCDSFRCDRIGEVRYSNDKAVYYVHFPNKVGIVDFWLFEFQAELIKLKVIGNIYENPELLKECKDE